MHIYFILFGGAAPTSRPILYAALPCRHPAISLHYMLIFFEIKPKIQTEV
jgi:hypothetical protein